jgi:hypothetical protein
VRNRSQDNIQYVPNVTQNDEIRARNQPLSGAHGVIEHRSSIAKRAFVLGLREKGIPRSAGMQFGSARVFVCNDT